MAVIAAINTVNKIPDRTAVIAAINTVNKIPDRTAVIAAIFTQLLITRQNYQELYPNVSRITEGWG
jgi:hypothetical protein